MFSTSEEGRRVEKVLYEGFWQEMKKKDQYKQKELVGKYIPHCSPSQPSVPNLDGKNTNCGTYKENVVAVKLDGSVAIVFLCSVH